MAHGYTCDRCEKFVEQSGPFAREEIHELNGSVEELRVADPNTDGSEGPGLNRYTLCEDCRAALVNWVEEGTTDNFFANLETANVSWSIGFDPYEPYAALENVPGVGKEKAKALYDAGYRTKTDLKKASQSDLSEVDTIGRALAARIKADVGEYRSATDVVEDIEYIIDEFGGDE